MGQTAKTIDTRRVSFDSTVPCCVAVLFALQKDARADTVTVAAFVVGADVAISPVSVDWSELPGTGPSSRTDSNILSCQWNFLVSPLAVRTESWANVRFKLHTLVLLFVASGSERCLYLELQGER